MLIRLITRLPKITPKITPVRQPARNLETPPRSPNARHPVTPPVTNVTPDGGATLIRAQCTVSYIACKATDVCTVRSGAPLLELS